MMYRATMQRIDNGERCHTVLDAESIWHAIEEVIWEYGEECWILAVDYIHPPADWDGRYVLLDTSTNCWGTGDVKYESKEEAIADGDNGAEVLIVVPNKGD